MKGFVPLHLNAQAGLPNLSKLKKKNIRKALFKWITEQRGCFVVQFDLPSKVDHALCVDGRGQLVWDNQE